MWALKRSKQAFVGVRGEKVFKAMIWTKGQSISISSTGTFGDMLSASDAARPVISSTALAGTQCFLVSLCHVMRTFPFGARFWFVRRTLEGLSGIETFGSFLPAF